MLRVLKLDSIRQTALSPNILFLPAVFQFLLCLFPLTFEGFLDVGINVQARCGFLTLELYPSMSEFLNCLLFNLLLNTSSSTVCLWEVPVRQLVSWTFSNKWKSNQDFTVKDLLSSLSVFFGGFLWEKRDENRQPVLSGPLGESNTSCQNSLVSRKTDYQ